MGSYTLRKKRKQAHLDAPRRFTSGKNRNLLVVEGPHRMVIILDGLKPSFNIGKIFLSGDAFGVRNIHLINTNFFDLAPA